MLLKSHSQGGISGVEMGSKDEADDLPQAAVELSRDGVPDRARQRYAIFSLLQLNDLAYRIINDDFAVVDRSKSLLDGVLLLNRQERPDQEKARMTFLSLIHRYPQSRPRRRSSA